SVLALLSAPVLSGTMAGRGDFGLAVIAILGGAALAWFVVDARARADGERRALVEAGRGLSAQHLLAQMMLDNEDNAVVLLDRDERIVAASRAVLVRAGGVAD